MARELLERFKRTGHLPSPPGTVTRLMALCQDDEVPLADLIDTVAADPALSLRLLKYANSSLVGSNEPITTVRDAILCLGVRSVRLMALNFSVMSTREESRCRGFDYARFWCHSVTCGVAARHLARRTNNVSPDEAFTAGLLASTGKMVFAASRPKEYAEILKLSGGITGPTAALEEQHFGTSFADLSAELIQDWGIPERLAQVVRYHKRPADLTESADLQRFAMIVGTAALIADILAWADNERNLARHCDVLVGSEFFPDIAQAQAAVESIRKEAAEIVAIMTLKTAAVADATEIQRQAARLRTELSVADQLRATTAKVNTALHSRQQVRPQPSKTELDALESELTRRSREAIAVGATVTLVLVDVDQFQDIVSSHGVPAGDVTLQSVAGVLQQQLRSADMVVRFGPSTFAVLLAGMDHLIVAKICVRIRRSVEAASGVRAHGLPPFTVSIGAAQWIPVEGGPAAATIVESAMRQLCRSKAKGCNTCSMKLYQVPRSYPDERTPADAPPGEGVLIGT